MIQRPALPLGSTLFLAACSVLAPDRSAKSVTVVLPATILVRDTVQAFADARDGSGRSIKGDTTVTWASSSPGAISIDQLGRVTSSTLGAQATISATVQGVTGTLAVTVGDDQRLGYTLADQPVNPGPYTPAAATSFNSSGGAVTVLRGGAGVYEVKFAGLGRTSGQRDNVLVTAFGATAIFCNLSGWQTEGPDLVASVRCYAAAGASADSKFTILLSGARPYEPSSRFGFALAPVLSVGGSLNLPDTSGTLRNSSSRTIVQFGHPATGDYPLNFPGLARASAGPQSGPETIQVTAVAPGPERCRLNAVDVAVDVSVYGLDVLCSTTGGTAIDSRFSVMLFQRGRPNPLHFAYVWMDNPNPPLDYPPGNGLGRNNSGLGITIRRTGIGQYRVLFIGQAFAAGATQTVLLTPFPNDAICNTTGWANVGADFAVTVACFDLTGAPANATFNVLMLQ